jgi:phosphoglycerate dehydrogenase-like enzyme
MKEHIPDDWHHTLRGLPSLARLAGAGALVLFRESTAVTRALLTHPGVIAMPRIGFVTEDELDLQFTGICDQINAFAAKAPVHMINPKVWQG